MARTKKYKTEEELSEAIEKYFNDCEKDKKMPNKAGICVFLGISRDTYSEYRKSYPDTIKDTDRKIEDAWVQRLGGNSPTGAIFYLKNAFAYRDRNETDITTKGNEVIFSHGQILRIAKNTVEGTNSDGDSKGKE